MKPATSGGGWKAVRYTLRMANRRAGCRCGAPCAAGTPARPARSAWAASWAAWSTRPATFPKSARSRCRRWSPTCRAASRRDFFARYSIAAAAGALAARARIVRPARRIRSTPRPGDTHYRADRVGRGARPARGDSCKRSGPDAASSTPAADRRTKPASCCSSSPGCSARNYVNNCSYYCHQASGVGLATRTRHRHGDGQLDDVEHADLYILIGGNPASNHPRLLRSLMADPPPRRARHRHQPGRRRSASSTSACRSDSASLLFGTRDRQPLRPAAHRRRHRAAHRRRQARARTRRRTTDAFIDAAHRRVRRRSHGRSSRRPWDEIEPAAGVAARRRSTQVAEMYMAAKQRRVRLDDGDHASSARRRERADDRQPRAAARHGRPARARA